MAYRGEDLDLRTPQGWGSPGRETGGEPNWWTRSTIYKGGRADPIWVDDSVLAACNHAYDLAVAHRASEVRLEHLINALSLSDQAAQVLEARGLSVASLRRESGATIANDIPTTSAHMSPKRSEALVETLRLAADRAYPRRTPVTVDDLLHVLFDMRRDLPGAQLLHRHAQGWSGRNGIDQRPGLRLEPLPHLARPYAQPEPRFASPAAHDYFSQGARDIAREPTREMPREIMREAPPREPLRAPARDMSREIQREPSRSSREPSMAAAPVDQLQNNRIDALERLVRDLGIDLADDRKSLQALVTDLQRTASAQADDTGRFRGNLSDRLQQLEDIVARSHNEASQLPAAVLDRMGSIERNIEARLVDAGRMTQVPQAVFDRLASIERTVDARLADVGRSASVPQVLIDRIAAIEQGIENRLSDIARLTVITGERLQALEGAAQRPVEATLTPLVNQRLEAITSFGSKINDLERTFQVILDRLTGLERSVNNRPEQKPIDLTPLDLRLAEVETRIVKGIESSTDLSPVTDLLSGMEARVAGLERSLENRSAETGRTVSFIGDRLRAFEEAISGQRTQTGDRLGQLERSLTAYAESTVAAGGSHTRELTELHEAILKLNANQQTLANALDQWRLDNTGDLSVLNNRLKAIEDTELKEAPKFDDLAGQIAGLHAILSKKEVRKSRFRNWLFGTDEWYSASYDTERWRARQTDLAIAEVRPAPKRPQAPPTPQRG